MRTIVLADHIPQVCHTSAECALGGELVELVGDPNAFTELACDLYSRFHPRRGITRMVSAVDVSLLEGAPGVRCEVSWGPGVLARFFGDTSLALHPEVLARMFLLALHPEEARKIMLNHPGFWWVHDDFYNRDGTAVQPKVAVPTTPFKWIEPSHPVKPFDF